MKILAYFDKKDYEPLLPRNVRYSANAIIFKGGRIAMVYAEKYEAYIFPGGGKESGETIREALIREVREETGLIVVPSSIRDFGKVVGIRKDGFGNGIYERHACFFTCAAEDETVEQSLTESELEYGHKFLYVDIGEAIAANAQKGYIWTEDVTYVLKLLAGSGLDEI